MDFGWIKIFPEVSLINIPDTSFPILIGSSRSEDTQARIQCCRSLRDSMSRTDCLTTYKTFGLMNLGRLFSPLSLDV